MEGVARRAPTGRARSSSPRTLRCRRCGSAPRPWPRAVPSRAIPMLAWIFASLPTTENVAFSALGDSPRGVLRLGTSVFSSRTANSSPPSRAGCRTAGSARSRSATCVSSSSPAAWPQLSLTFLKWSRSRKRTACDRLAGALTRERLGDAVGEEHAVRQAGERVVVRLMAELLLQLRHLRERLLEPAVLEQHAGVAGERLEQLEVGLGERAHVADPVADEQKPETRAPRRGARRRSHRPGHAPRGTGRVDGVSAAAEQKRPYVRFTAIAARRSAPSPRPCVFSAARHLPMLPRTEHCQSRSHGADIAEHFGQAADVPLASQPYRSPSRAHDQPSR